MLSVLNTKPSSERSEIVRELGGSAGLGLRESAGRQEGTSPFTPITALRPVVGDPSVDERTSPLDLALGATGRAVAVFSGAARGAATAARKAMPVLDPLVRLPMRAPLSERLRPWLARLDPLNREGAAHRESLVDGLGALLDVLVPRVFVEVLSRAHLTELVPRYVDLDAIIDRVDVDAVVAKVDMDAIIDRVDVDAVVAKVDLDAIIDRVDVDGVAERLDVSRVLDRMNLTSIVLQRVDLDALTQAVLARIDLIGLAEQVIDGVNLAEIIRESTGSMASDTVQGVRFQGIAADEAISHAMDRFRLRHGRHSLRGSNGHPQSETVGEDPPFASSERMP